jgi:Predicted methyltransferase
MRPPEDFIRSRLVPEPLPFRPDIKLYRPTPQSGLIAWLAEQGRAEDPPYWAYAWAGGAALTLYMRDNPHLVAGRSALDFGAGSGLVGIAAARAGAIVAAFEPDPIGRAAIALNAAANGVTIEIVDVPMAAEIVLAGDVFYDKAVAGRTLPALQALAAKGATVLVGDPFRRDLPQAALTLLAEYEVPDMGGGAWLRAGIFALRP